MTLSPSRRPPRPLNLRLLNDYEVVVVGLRSMLEPFADRIRVVETEVGSVSDVTADLTLYDTFGRSQVEGLDLDEVLRDSDAGQVVVYTWNMRAEFIRSALDKGCRGYLDKSMGAEDLVRCLEAIHRGEVMVSDTADFIRPETDEPGEPVSRRGFWPGQDVGLTAREAEIIALVTQGLTNADIAERCYITINSLKSCIRSAYRKMGVERRSQAVRWGMEHGMTPPSARGREPQRS
ncbi:response regulator transcription factor [Corynebacteriaceae bacterium 7-707]